MDAQYLIKKGKEEVLFLCDVYCVNQCVIEGI